MNANEMTVHLHRLNQVNEASADRIRYAGRMAFMYWTRQWPFIGAISAASLAACELQSIVEAHDPKTVSADWK